MQLPRDDQSHLPNPSIEQTATLTSEKQREHCDSSPFPTLFSPLLWCCWSPLTPWSRPFRQLAHCTHAAAGHSSPNELVPGALPACVIALAGSAVPRLQRQRPTLQQLPLQSPVVRRPPPESDGNLDVVPIPPWSASLAPSRPHGVQQSSPNHPSIINWPRLSRLPAHRPSPIMSWRAGEKLMDTIRHYASFPATGVSLRQMVQFGEKPSTGEP